MGRRLKLRQHDTLSSRQGCGEHGEPHGSGNHDRIAARRNSPIDVVFHWQLGRAARQPLAGALRDACTLWTVWHTRRIGMQRRTSRPCRRPRNTCAGIRGANPSHRAQLSAEMKRADLSISPWSRRVGSCVADFAAILAQVHVCGARARLLCFTSRAPRSGRHVAAGDRNGRAPISARYAGRLYEDFRRSRFYGSCKNKTGRRYGLPVWVRMPAGIGLRSIWPSWPGCSRSKLRQIERGAHARLSCVPERFQSTPQPNHVLIRWSIRNSAGHMAWVGDRQHPHADETCCPCFTQSL